MDATKIPRELRARKQWCVWLIEERQNTKGEWKKTKTPHQVGDKPRRPTFKSNDPGTWATFEQAEHALNSGWWEGFGYVFSKDDPYTGIDLDHCRDLETGEIDGWAQDVLNRFGPTFCEVSPSGTGLKLWTRAAKSRKGAKRGRRHFPDQWKDGADKDAEIEIYDRTRYFTVTTNTLAGHDGILDGQQALDDLMALLWPKKESKPPPKSTEPLDIDDAALLDKARGAANGDAFGRLWNGDTSDHDDDHSAADLALCSKLMFWTGNDHHRTDMLFRQSGLMRKKWHREDYRGWTLDKAVQHEIYTPNGRRRRQAPRAEDVPHPADGDDGGNGGGSGEILDGTILYHYPSAPIQSNAEIPYPYVVGADGEVMKAIIAEGGEPKNLPVCDGPLLITDLDHDVNDGCTYATIVFRGDGDVWGDCVVKKGVIANSNKISELANFGAPVLSTKGKMLIEWLRSYEKENYAVIRHRRISGMLGWHSNGDHLDGFLFADEWMGSGRNEIHHQSEYGITQLAQAVKAVGDPTEELRALEIACQFPAVATVIGASLAAPLLRILECPPFTLSLCGTTSTGKTSALIVAGAIWGNTDERKPDSILQTWNQTQNAIIEKASSLDGIPLMLDDTQVAPGKYIIQNIIYALSTGRSKGRLNRSGKAVGEKSSRTILISTGEMPMLDSSQQGGTMARVLDVWGRPWGEYVASTGKAIRACMKLTSESYGNTGRRWLRFILDNRAFWAAWRREHRARCVQLEDFLAERHGDRHGALLGRLAEYIAVIERALHLANEAGIIADQDQRIQIRVVNKLVSEAIEDAVSNDVFAAALKTAMEIATARRSEMFNASGSYDDKKPFRGWIGRWDSGTADRIYFVPSALKRILSDEGFTPEAVIREWASRGHLVMQGKKKRHTVVALLDGKQTRMVALEIEKVIEEIGFDPNDEEVDQQKFKDSEE